MAHSKSTPNVNLPQFTETDKPSWLGDINEFAAKVDAEFGRLQGIINQLQAQINGKVDK